MKVAYHFNCSHVNDRYDSLFYNIVFSEILKINDPFFSSKILVGDLLIYEMINKVDDPEVFLSYLFQEKGDNWKRIKTDKLKSFLEDNVFIICFETIQKETATKLNEVLLKENRYLGAFEIDNSIELHWWLYGECIGPKFRILNRSINILIDSDEIESQEYAEDMKEGLYKIPFDKIETEFSNYRHSLFDDKHNYENARRATEWKKGTESMFATITDEIVAKLTDTAPDLTDKLWSIYNVFSNAQTGEQYAQAMTSCRRVFEYVTDCLFPATSDIIEGHSLKKANYKNRLYEFAKREVRSETNIDLIVTNTASLFDEWNKLYELSNKGVHSDPHKQECRRCIIRTILLLDDLIAIKRTPFEVNIKADKLINDFKERHNPNS